MEKDSTPGGRHPQWHVQKSDGAPSQRHAHCAVVWKDALFILGGYDSGNHLGDFFVYRFDSGKWSEVKSQGKPPSARHSHSAVLFGSSMYIFGGIGPKGILLNDVYEFDFERFTWHEVAVSGTEAPAGRWGHTSVIYGQSMFIYAGLTGKGYVDDLWEFHFNSRSWSRVNVTGDIPSSRHFHASVVVHDTMYVFGGFGHKNMDDLNAFDFATCRWREVKAESDSGTIPAPRRGHSMVSIAPDLLVVFGGRSNTNLADTHLFNLSSLTWHPLECGGKTLPPPRHFHSASAYKNNIYVFGGIAGKIGSLNDLFRLSLGSWVNTAVSPPSTPTSVPSNILASPLREDAFSGGDSIGSNKQGSLGSMSSASPALSRTSAGGGLSGSATKIRLKCQFADEIRVIPVSKMIELTDLKNLISESGGLGSTEAFLIQYKDEEDDLITIRSTEELHEAFDACEEEKQKFFRIFINYSSSSSPANSARTVSSQPQRRDSTGSSPPRRRSEDLNPPQSHSPSSSSGAFPVKGRHSPQTSGSPQMGSHHQHQQQQQQPPPTPKMPVRYKLGTMLGRGAFGTVFLGLDEDTGHLFALKKIQIDPTHNNASAQLDRLQNEIRLLSKIQHPNIVQYLGSSLDKAAQQLLIFLEYVAGGSLMSMMSKFGPFKESVVRQYCMQVMKGLELLHQRGIVHRDIKSANILVDSNGNIKLSDFGAATSIATLTSHTQIVEAGESQLKSFAGTPYWMAPEVIRQNSYGRKCDVWALGCTLIELTTGKPPWSHLNPVTALFQIANEDEKPPSAPAHLSPQCQDFISRCLTRDADKRPTVHELTQHSWMVDEIEFPDVTDEADFGSPPAEGAFALSEDGESSSDWSSGNYSPNSTFRGGRPPRSVSDGSAPNMSQLASNSFKNQRK
eukprot:TRINITY_DN11597_c0_g1_i1.p1 TRINITY_DN11597_c0_g1~~TRINITY_DN11597_c0_g1_i1.p1  ORF type:complete len:902 (-),score=157.14 TRINITY_DN11597_c0_g1_i1:580-3285(-)